MSYELVLIGGMPWSGKSSISQGVLEADTSREIRHVSMGDRMRGIGTSAIQSIYSEALASNIDGLKKHTAMPQDIAVGVFEEFIQQKPSGLVLVDGFPRYPHRVEAFKNSVDKLDARVLAVCHIVVSDEVAIERSQGRAARITEDEKASDAVVKRIEEFHTTVQPTIAQLSEQYPYYELDGTQPISKNVSLVQQIIQKHSAVA